ncbi:alsin-like isoform X2 [Lampris incognitus]|uniref:alsin-like isoform X2 n=1 Tax=Lampris incognitus TaxID=2546036 RepID=UPI0024B50F5F|nr:alsin-like isoform X2 [Lampris incognitus]
MEIENKESPVDEQGTPPTERGLLHLWQAGVTSEGLCPDRVLLSRPILQASLGAYHGLILAQGGLVYSFGQLPWRQGLCVPAASPLLESSLAMQMVVKIAAGGFHCGAVTEQGGVYMWGENSAGQCGLTDKGGIHGKRGLPDRGTLFIPEPSPVSVVDNEVLPTVLVKVVELACGMEHTLALSAKHELWAWGSGCQLGLVTKTFPVWRPQKVEHLAGRHVIQVVCGGYHSLALVRGLPSQNYDAQNPSEGFEARQQPDYSAIERDELITVDDAHYCPLGVELAEVTSGKGCLRRSMPRRRLLAAERLASASPASEASPCLYSESQKPVHASDLGNRMPSATTTLDKMNQPFQAELEPDGQAEHPTQTDSTDKACPLAGLRRNKKSAPCDELALQDFLQRLSGRSLEEQGARGAGETNSSDDSYPSSVSEPSRDLLESSYEDDSPVRRNTNSNRGVSMLCSSAPVCVEEVRVSIEEEAVGRKSSSLTDITLEESPEVKRRCSLPGTPTHGTPRYRSPGYRISSGGRMTKRGKGRTQGVGLEEARDGMPHLGTEVWSWGRGMEGQLGHGDHLPRLQPLCVKSLTGEQVVKLAAGTHHSLALTAQCQVYSWGSNMCGQLGHINSPATIPQQAKLTEGIHVWDVSAGQSHSLLLADGDCVQPIIYYCGQQPVSQPYLAKTERSSQGQRLCQRSPNRAETYTVRPLLLPFCMEMGYVSGVFSGGQMCAALADQNVMGFISASHELASKERQQYCWLYNISKDILKPLLNKESTCSSLGQPCSRLFLSLSESLVHLSALTGRHSVSLTHFLQNTQRYDVTSLPLLVHADLFMDAYKEYCASVGNFQVMGGFQSLHKLSVECFGKQQDVVFRLCGVDQAGSTEVMVVLFYLPLQHLHQYSRSLLKLAACYDVSTPEYMSLHQGCSQYESLSLSLWRSRKEAEATALFWKTYSTKTADLLCRPERRVVCESSNRGLTLQNAGRFSSHWFILFNDVLVHTQGTIPSKSLFSSHHVYPLTCLWVRPVTDDSSGLAIKVTCPEESFTLVASTPQEKNKWLHALNQAVEHALGGGGQGSSPRVTGVPAVSRSASYTFTGEGRLKDAHYSGGWLAGKIHGRGTMKWPDGRSYTGNFKNGLEDGYGECVILNKLLNKPDRYRGHWKEGKIHGFGTYKYASGEVYEGCFYDGQRHGYGMLSSGKLTRTSSSVFIGVWVHDRKTGYGVFDDITRGEKYMGLWLDDQKQGNAVVVTQFGLYYEGTFRDNKMNGTGLLISEDDTSFHGEFSEDWAVSGKGVLTLANGDCLDGLFSGEWTTGLKVIGTYTKPIHYEHDSKDRGWQLEVGRYKVPAEQRWQCVFEECWSRLGCDPAGTPDRSTAWEKIAVTITAGRRESPDLSRSQSRVLEHLEWIPRHGEPITASNFSNIRRYLAKACDTPLHPLGWLVETLVTVYRMTYVGVGSNRRLLKEAVQEIRSYLTRIFSIVRFLFPGLPDEGSLIPSPPCSPSSAVLSTHDRLANTSQGSGQVVSCSSLLLPVLLPRLYPPLFTLYCLEEERKEVVYWESILRLNKQPDQSLLSFLEVPEKFWPVSMSVLGERRQILSTSKDACFIPAVETLQQISTTFTPSDKLVVIQRTFKELTQEVKSSQVDNFLWSMDELIPLFIYVVVRARIRNLGAEICLIEDLMDPSLQHGELGMMFTTLKACYFHIQHEKTA